MAIDVLGFLGEQRSHNDGFQEEWIALENLYSRKLWHQLTERLQALVRRVQSPDLAMQLYTRFTADFESKLNQLSLADIFLVIARTLKDPNTTVEFLRKGAEKVRSTVPAHVLCLCEIADIELRAGKTAEAKALLDDVEKLLGELDSVEPQIHAPFYRVSADYFKTKGDFSDYYRNALKYLGCIDVQTLPSSDAIVRAYDLGLAALLADDIYNFGELLAHPILAALANTDKEWLVRLLYAFNSGDIDKYGGLQPHWKAQADLANNVMRLQQKITLLSLMELVFKRPAENRTIPFRIIAKETKLALEDVELIVMKALSLGLIRGTIDQVDEVVHVTWVQPRVLDLKQIALLQSRVKEWSLNVNKAVLFVEENGRGVVA
eukprot:Opistho-2@80820